MAMCPHGYVETECEVCTLRTRLDEAERVLADYKQQHCDDTDTIAENYQKLANVEKREARFRKILLVETCDCGAAENPIEQHREDCAGRLNVGCADLNCEERAEKE